MAQVFTIVPVISGAKLQKKSASCIVIRHIFVLLQPKRKDYGTEPLN
jgi:hypothetical protein